MSTQKVTNNQEEGRELRKNVISFLIALIIVSFFVWVIGSCQLYSGTGWRTASFSFIGTSERAATFFSAMLSFLVFLNLTLTTVIISGYARSTSDVGDVRSFMGVWVIFAIANVSLAVVAWIPLHVNYLWHWIFGVAAVNYYLGGIFVMSRMIGGDIGSAMIRLLVAALIISGGGWAITGNIVFPEIVILVVVMTWHFLMVAGLYPEKDYPLISGLQR